MNFRTARTLVVAAAIAVISWGCTETPSETSANRTMGDAMRDASVTMHIKTAYTFSGHFNPFRIDVDTRDGVVTLHGEVKSDVHRDLAEEIAKNAEGVSEVRNELQIVPAQAGALEEADSPGEAKNTAAETPADSTSPQLH